MAVKRLEERLTEYNILETGWEINYNEVMAGGQGRVYPVKKNIGNKLLIDAIKVISIPSEGEEQQWKYKSESTIKTEITKRKEEAKKEYEMLLELKGNNHVIPVKDVTVKTFDLISKGDQLGYDIIIRMDYLSSLENYLFENNFQSFSNEEIVNCGIQICTALECLHSKNITHRDIKPGNIFVSKVPNDNLMFYLGDFGSAKGSSMGLSIGRSMTISGTELYLAPYWENTQYRIQRDLYALGLTLFWMATGGSLPYEETNCKEIMDDERIGAYIKRRILQQELPTGDINDKIASVIKKACSFQKADSGEITPRCYVNATQMRKALEKIKDSKGQNVENNIIKVEDESTENVVSDLELTVPEEMIEQKPVERIFTKRDYKGEQILVIGDEYTGIADYALQGTPIVELTIGASVKTFGRKIWANCWSLKKLKVENYETVYEGDFDDCDRLEEASLPNCKIISENAFISCQFLERIDAPKCQEIRKNALKGCVALKKIELSKCEKVGACAFEGCIALEEIELRQCVEVGAKAFYNCEKITRIYMPKCSKIEKNAFTGCSVIEEIELADYIGTGLDDVYIKKITLLECKTLVAHAFLNCAKIKQIELLKCEEVGKYAFAGCRGLCQINLPKCRKIGDFAFAREKKYANTSACYSLESIELPQCEEVGKFAFSGCTKLRRLKLPKCRKIGDFAFSGYDITNSEYYDSGNFERLPHSKEDEYRWNRLDLSACYTLEDVELPLCEVLGAFAFARCVSLSHVKMPKCKMVGAFAFAGCGEVHSKYGKFNGLRSIELPQCEMMENGVFYGCDNLQTVSLTQCKKVGHNAFESCESIEKIELLQCEEIEYGTFWKCGNLQRVSIPRCKKIGEAAFGFCKTLEELELLQCEEIGNRGIYKCDNLKKINMPKCKKIGGLMFAECWNLKEVRLAEDANWSRVGFTVQKIKNRMRKKR